MTARIIVLPITDIVAVANPGKPSDAEDKAYNAWITQRVAEVIQGGAESVEVVYRDGSVDRLALDDEGRLKAVSVS